MEIDIVEIRAACYFALRGQVKQISEDDLAGIRSLHEHLLPIPITPPRLQRLNFSLVVEPQVRLYQKYSANIYFDFHQLKNDRLLLVLNNQIKLPHIGFIHQLQNLHYDLTGELLLRAGGDKTIIRSIKTPGRI